MARKYIESGEFRKRYTGSPQLGGAYKEEVLDTYIEIATANVEQFTERVFSAAQYIERFRGDDTNTHLLYNYPIVTTGDYLPAVSVFDLDGTASADTLTFPDDFIDITENAAVGRLELQTLTFSSANLYEVTYTAGYDELPVAVKHATALWVTELMRPDYFPNDGRTPELIPLTSEQISDLLGPMRRRRISRAG